jgi:hypothetical protein
MARNVGVNTTFEQQRLVINEIAVDVETLQNAGYITGYAEQDNLGTVLARGNQATSDILLAGIITATSFVGDGSNLTGISAGAGGTDNVSTSTLTVAGVSTFTGRIVGSATTNIIPFLYADLSDLPSPSEYHGAFAHVHATGKAYYAHAGAWVELVNIDGGTVTATTFDGNLTGNVTGNADTATNLNGNIYNLNTSGIITATQFVGDGSGLTGVVAEGTGIVIQEEGSSVGTAGTINFIGAGVTATLSNGIASVEITATGGGGGISNVIEDTTPQLGGNLDINNKYITGTGGANITGVVTATRFESTSAGTPTIDSPNNLNINAVTVAISTNLTAGGSVTATSFVGDGSGLTGVVGSGSGVVVQEEGSSVGTAGTINFIGAGVTATFVGGIASVEITTSADTLATVTARGNTTTAEITAANFRSNDTTGDGSDIGFAFKYYITSDGSLSYRFAGPGVLNSTDNPTLYFHRGFTYILENSTGSGHPFELRVSNGGAAYAPGGNFLTGSINGTQILTVPFNAPNSIVYQCTLHGGMVGTINIVS